MDEPPVFDVERRELRVGDVVVKRFRQPTPDQETMLLAFEEAGWPVRIDGPLPPRKVSVGVGESFLLRTA
jgi:hypothetical protein